MKRVYTILATAWVTALAPVAAAEAPTEKATSGTQSPAEAPTSPATPNDTTSAEPVEPSGEGNEATAAEATAVPAEQTAEPKKKESVEEIVSETEDDDPFYRNDPKPKTGMGTLIPGWVLVGIGALNLATSPICNTSAVKESQQDLCFKLSLGVGIAGVAIGVPLLIVGYGQRSTFNEWKSRHPNASWLLNTQVALARDGATVLYNGSF